MQPNSDCLTSVTASWWTAFQVLQSYNSYALQFMHIKHTIQWFLVCSLSSPTIIFMLALKYLHYSHLHRTKMEIFMVRNYAYTAKLQKYLTRNTKWSFILVFNYNRGENEDRSPLPEIMQSSFPHLKKCQGSAHL